MKKTLEEATETSRKGYISDESDIGWIIQKMISVPMSHFPKKNTEILIYYACHFMSDCGMDSNRVYEVTFGEMLAMIELMYCYEAYIYDEQYLREGLRCIQLAHMQKLLFEQYPKNNTVHLFMSVTVKGYLNYLAEKAGISVDKSYQNFRNKVKDGLKADIDDETTVRSFIKTTSLIQSQNWAPIIPLEKYESDIRFCYKTLYYFFIKPFKQAFPEYFNLKKIKEKYAKENFT